jgi:lipopolysaccharide cholinephosphotransferase
MNELAKNSEILHQLKETERDELRTCLLEIFNDVVKVCEKYHLTIMVCGGQLLGLFAIMVLFHGMMTSM